MTLFLTDEINAFAPYHVYETKEANSIIFFSDSGIKIVVSFIKDEIMEECDNIYQFLVETQSSQRSPNDPKVGETIACIAKAFFYHHSDCLLTFVCDISDTKQAARQRLFSRWFQKFNQNKYCKYDWVINTEDCVFYASMMACKEFPYLEDYRNAYEEFVASLQK